MDCVIFGFRGLIVAFFVMMKKSHVLSIGGQPRVAEINISPLHHTTIEMGGTNITVAVFPLDPPLRLPRLYQPGDLVSEIIKYPWLVPLMFGVSGIEAFISREEWKEYAAYEWTEEIYEEVAGLRNALESVPQRNPVWVDAYSQITEMVLCLINGEQFLHTKFSSYEKSGKKIGSVTGKLKLLDGRWKRFSDYDEGALAEALLNCHEKASELVEKGKLQTNPIEKLK